MTYNEYLESLMKENGLSLIEGAKATQDNLKEVLRAAEVEYMGKDAFRTISGEAEEKEIKSKKGFDMDAAEESLTTIMLQVVDHKRQMKATNDIGVKKENRARLEVAAKKARKEFERLFELVKKDGTKEDVIKFLLWCRERRLVEENKEASHLLNLLEYSEIDKDSVCECFRNPPSGLLAKASEEYRYSKKWDSDRQQNIYTVFIEVTRTGEDQLTRQATQKQSRGIELTEGDYLPDRIDIKRRVLKATEFSKYFREL